MLDYSKEEGRETTLRRVKEIVLPDKVFFPLRKARVKAEEDLRVQSVKRVTMVESGTNTEFAEAPTAPEETKTETVKISGFLSVF